MDEAFMEIMSQMRNSVKDYPDGEIRLDNTDFVKLVEIAERAEVLRKSTENLRQDSFRRTLRGYRKMEEEVQYAREDNLEFSKLMLKMKNQYESMYAALKYISEQDLGGVHTYAFQVLEQIEKGEKWDGKN